MTTDNTQELDEILDAFASGEVSPHWKDKRKTYTKLEAKQAILDWHNKHELEARINENNMYIRELTRHYFPSGYGEPHIPLVQFHERIAELKAEKEEV